MRISVFFVMVVVLSSSSILAQRYEMVWSDEFNQSELDTDIWKAWIGTAYNNEHQYYSSRDTNILVKEGFLHLVGLRENYGGRNWSSGRIESENNFDFQYGKVEIRAKLPAGKGLWPAFWMLGSNMNQVEWPYSGEIDIMEYRGNLVSQTSGTIHFSSVPPPGSGNHVADRRYTGKEYTLPSGNFTDEFRLFQFEWTDSTMTWFIDDVEFFHLTKKEILNQTRYYPFDQPFYFILNLAIGGDFLGDQQPDNSTPDRNEVIVDYIRVYQDINEVPEVTTTFEHSNQVQPLEAINLEAAVTDGDGTIQKVEFYINEKLIERIHTPPFSTSWLPRIDGCFPLSIKAYDNDNGVGYSEEAEFIVGSGCEKRPFFEEPISFPGTLQLEHFDYGGHENSYFDSSPDSNLGNGLGNDFRTTEAVDIIPDELEDGNHLLTELENGEWTKYSLTVEQSGIYDLEFRSVAGKGSGRIDFKLNGEHWIYFTRILSNSDDPYVVKKVSDITIEEGDYELEMFVAISGGVKPDYLKAILKEATSNEQNQNAKPSQIRLNQNYPNPFNPSTTISFHLPASQAVKLEVFNSLGQPVSVVYSGRLSLGNHSFEFNASQLSSGVYYYQLSVDAGIFIQKMILLK